MPLKRILLVDDEADIRTVARFSLEKVGGWEVLCASTGEEGVALARTEGPDLILLDMMMPEMDGQETLQALRTQEETSSIPVIFMTARVQEKEVERYLQLGATGVIKKPFDPMQLPAEIRRIADSA